MVTPLSETSASIPFWLSYEETYEIDDGSIQALQELFRTLSDTTLVIRDSLSLSLALDRYNIPPNADAGRDDWTYSDTGEVLNEAKYRYKESAERLLGAKLVKLVAGHPVLSRVDAVCAIPASNADRESRPDPAKNWVAAISDDLLIDATTITRTREVKSQKDIENDVAALAANQEQSMEAVPGEVAGRRVLIIDDMYGSGGTMQEANRALREAGAADVFSLVVAKHARYMQGSPCAD